MEGHPDYWDEETVERVDNAFASLDIEYLTIRGNHSNPHVFDGSLNLPSFLLIPDYTRMEIDGQEWLSVGGAVSVNRSDRIEGQPGGPKRKWFAGKNWRGKPTCSSPMPGRPGSGHPDATAGSTTTFQPKP